MNLNQLALTIVRIATAGNMIIHGISRLQEGTVSNFDGWLNSLGFPPFTAWGITFFEIIAGVVLIWGKKWVSIICIIFCIQLIVGIILVHGPEGWFVVGAGRNGMEYSVLLIICFASTAIANWKK
ncbi:MAG TPA: DoxX family protein [Cyclobacteriaceae bacterium]